MATTTDVYMQEIPESVQATVNSIHSELRPKSVTRGAKVWTAERRDQASLKSKERIAAKKSSPVGGREGKADARRHPVFDKGFGNLLTNATKRSEKQFAPLR